MNKNIKEIHFSFENCEGIIVPYECFSRFDFTTDAEDKFKITHLNCEIKDNGNSKYTTTWTNNNTSPIQRLGQYPDITSIDITYDDNSNDDYGVKWYWDDEDEYNIPEENKNQHNNLIGYNEIHITVKPYIKSYFIYEIFNLPTNTLLKDDTENTYIILLDENSNKYLATHEYKFPISISETTVQAKYYLCN
jgi:hypothetical protein